MTSATLTTAATAPSPRPAGPRISAEELQAFQRDGYHVARGLFPAAEVAAMREHFMGLHARAPIYECYATEPGSSDPLKVHPRMMQPHRWDLRARAWMLDGRIMAALQGLIEDEPLAAQSMFYYKPPGAAGQEFHQDNFYLMANPGTCYAAWLAVDDADAGNGGLFVVPGSHRGGLCSPARGDSKPWGSIIPQPEPAACREVAMAAGDCLFFHGSLIHGSLANTSATRFRRSFICHFVGRQRTTEIAAYYHPIIDQSGRIVPLGSGLAMPPGPAA
jgi:phytanoyl-CoA hydroxylase